MATNISHHHLPERVKKIIWAIDAFEDVPFLHQQAAQVLGYFTDGRQPVEIQPVFVASAGQAQIPPDLASPWSDEYRTAVRESLNRAIAHFPLTNLNPAEILGEADSSISQGVDTLSKFAVEFGADVILVNTHGRSGVKRFFLGSFAETLLHRSLVPVLVVGPKNKIASKVERIIFPTEFNEHSKVLFRQVMELANQLSAKVTLLHVYPRPSPDGLDFGYASDRFRLHGESVPFTKFRAYQIEHQTRRAKAWSEWAAHQGFTVDIQIDTQSETVEGGILGVSREDSAGRIIVMEAQSGPVRDTILGSTTRKIVRSAACPVYVLTSHYVESLFFKKDAA
jgi:nucleotide-binding universal stress UspA family protein